MSDQNQQADFQVPVPPLSEPQNASEISEPITYTKYPHLTKLKTIQKKIFGSGKAIATILGLTILFGGVAAGVRLTQQPQIFEQKASLPLQKTSNVLVIEFNPLLANGKRLNIDRGWQDPETLEQSYIQNVSMISGGFADYKIVQRVVVDTWPELNDGFIYTEKKYFSCLTNSQNCHRPEGVNYLKILQDFNICKKVNSGEIQEVWAWNGPWFGFYESIMAGPYPFWTNAPPLKNTGCAKDVHIMGFSYERQLPEMLEDLGHRFEGTLKHTITDKGSTLWLDYTKNELSAPGDANCGSVHIPPNGTQDYDFSNTSPVLNSCEDWLLYPNRTGEKQVFGCEKWGCTSLGWQDYWLSHIPKTNTGTSSDNWWNYVINYQEPPPELPPLTCDPELGRTWCSNHGGIALTVNHDVFNWSECLSWCKEKMTLDLPLCQYNADGPRNCWVNYAPAGGINNCTWQYGTPPYGSCVKNQNPTPVPTNTPIPSFSPTPKPTPQKPAGVKNK